MLDKMVPEKTIKVYDKPKQPYFNKYIQEQRKVVNNREQGLAKIHEGSPVDSSYKKERNRYNKLLQFHKKQCITQKVLDNWKDTKGLFKLINKLTNNNKDNPLPNRPLEVLAEEFATYFLEKIKIMPWEKFNNINPFQPETKDVPEFRSFAPLYKQASIQNHNVNEIQVLWTGYSTNTHTQGNITSMPTLNNHHSKFITHHGRIQWRMENMLLCNHY